MAGVATRVQTVRVATGRDEADRLQRCTVDQMDTPKLQVGDVEDLSGGLEFHVLGTGARKVEVAIDLAARQIELHEATRELARSDEIAPVGAEVEVVDTKTVEFDGMTKGERVRVAQVEALLQLGDHDRRAAVRREVEVVRVVDGDVRPGDLPGTGIDRGS